jgi:hypothetical protein
MVGVRDYIKSLDTGVAFLCHYSRNCLLRTSPACAAPDYPPWQFSPLASHTPGICWFHPKHTAMPCDMRSMILVHMAMVASRKKLFLAATTMCIRAAKFALPVGWMICRFRPPRIISMLFPFPIPRGVMLNSHWRGSNAESPLPTPCPHQTVNLLHTTRTSWCCTVCDAGDGSMGMRWCG